LVTLSNVRPSAHDDAFDRYGESPEAGIRIDEVLAEDKAILANFLKQSRDHSGPSRKSKKGTMQ
jgi:hypothetical protein